MRTILATFLVLTGAAHAAGTIFTTLLGDGYQSYASAVTTDSQGNTYVAGMTAAPDFPTTKGAFQPAYAGDFDAFVAKIGPDGKIVWATYLGGSAEDYAAGIALDRSGNVWVTGSTGSLNFPVANAIQATFHNAAYNNQQSSGSMDAFVAKLDPTGGTLLYSTYLGSQVTGGATAIAVDPTGNAYVAVNVGTATGYPGTLNAPAQAGVFVTKLAPQGTLVFSYFHPTGTAAAMALDSSGNIYVAGCSGVPGTEFGDPQVQQAIVFAVSSDGSKTLWEKALGTSGQSTAAAIAVGNAGEIWVGGSTSSANFPLVHPLQSTLAERPLWRSTDGGATWAAVDNLPFALPQTMVVDPTTPGTLYEATADLGIFKSLDGGATWTPASSGIAAANVSALAIDPVHPQTLYAAASNKVYKSVDGAKSWTVIDTPPVALTQLAVDAQNPNIVYEVMEITSGLTGPPNLRRSTDGGATWATSDNIGTMVSMAVDPRASGHLVAVWNENLSKPGQVGPPIMAPLLYTSADKGVTWNPVAGAGSNSTNIVVDGSTNPSTMYVGLQSKSSDGGATWTALGPLPGASSAGAEAFAVDGAGNVYASYPGGKLFVSRDHAQTWSALGSPSQGESINSIVAAGSNLYARLGPSNFGVGFQSVNGTAGFLSKLSVDSTLEYSTYLRGHQSTEAYSAVYREPIFFDNQNWVAGIALNSAGDVVVTGGTRSVDFQTAMPLQPANAGLADAFAALISADGSALKYSTYLGGSRDDGGLAATLDSSGNIVVAGQTWSGDFPATDGAPLAPGAGSGFVAKLAIPVTPVITSVLNGASYLPGIEAGSWAMIKGSNLANIVRPWASDDFTGNNLPTSLSGVSVTIDGQPAFVSYISSTQINVQVPSDSTVGSVNVVVNNNGAVSAPAPAQLQSYAPALFMIPGTTTAIASVLPNYALVTSSAPAHPGDLVVLWATGFGPTSPQIPAGIVVSGIPFAPTPTVTIGGMGVPVLNSLLAPDGVGVYQITIQLPDNVPTGSVAIQASVGGAQTQPGTTIFVGKL